MIFIIGVLVVIITGYTFLFLFNVKSSSLPLNFALAWFVGAGYFSFVNSIFYFGLGINTGIITSITIVAIPIMIFGIVWAKYKTDNKYVPPVASKKTNRFKIYERILIGIIILTLIIIVCHGASTPSNGDDSFRIRAYTPFLVYDNITDENAKSLIFQNGVWPTFLPLLFWHLNGQPEQFYLNYLNLTTLIAFITILYFAPLVSGNEKQGLYNAFAILSIPLFIYHGTSTYMDIVLIMVFALGYLFFSMYLKSNEMIDIKLAILFFILTFLIKDKGGIAGITGIFMIIAYWLYGKYKRSEKSWKTIATFAVPLALFLVFLVLYSLNIDTLAQKVNVSKSIFLKNPKVPSEFIAALQYKAYGLFHSLFLSGNFGILFYVFMANVFLYARRIFLTKLIWEFILTSIIFIQIFMYMVVIYVRVDMHQAIVHRVVMMLAVICSLFLVSLWTYKPVEDG